MEPSGREIADLFSVVLDRSTAPSPVRKATGETADESVELGRQCLTDGDHQRAIEHFRAAIAQRQKGSVGDHVDLAGAYELAEMAPLALREYERVLRLSKESSEPRLGMSQLYKRQARYRDSIGHLEKALALEPSNAFFRFKLAEILRETGELDRALTEARLAVASDSGDSFYHYWLGDLLIEMRRCEEALMALRSAIDLSPGDDFLYLRAAVAFRGAGRRQEAVKAVRMASDLDPDKHLYHGFLELLLREMDLNEEADMESARADRMDDYDREALRRIAKECGLGETASE